MYIGNKKYQRPVFKMLWDSVTALLDAGKTVDVTVSEHKTKRTKAQNDFYWHQNTTIANFLNESGVKKPFDIPFNKDDIHEINKKYLGTITTTKLNTKEFCDYIERMFDWWINKTNGGWVPDESPYGYLEKTGVV